MLDVVRVHRFQLSLVVAAACWGGATVISKRAVEEIEPLTLLPLDGKPRWVVHQSGSRVRHRR